MKQIYILFIFISTLAFSQLTPPSELQEYYQDVDFNLTGENLYTEIATNVISKHSTFLSYSQRHNYLYDADQDSNNLDNVILIYSGESRYELEYLSSNNSYNPQTFNTEHVYPRSLVGNTAEGDLHHLRVCDVDVNSARGNLPFAAGSGSYGTVGSAWYPGDEWRGDVARIIMYMNVRYDEPFTSVGNLALFLEWNAADPVSSIEIQRNELISSVQGNRNPFIDNPIIATRIWSGPTAQDRWATLSLIETSNQDNFKIYPNPVTKGYFNINVSGETMVRITDVLGKLVGTYTVNQANKRIDVSNLYKGVYLVNLKSKNHTSVRKLIIK